MNNTKHIAQHISITILLIASKRRLSLAVFIMSDNPDLYKTINWEKIPGEHVHTYLSCIIN